MRLNVSGGKDVAIVTAYSMKSARVGPQNGSGTGFERYFYTNQSKPVTILRIVSRKCFQDCPNLCLFNHLAAPLPSLDSCHLLFPIYWRIASNSLRTRSLFSASACCKSWFRNFKMGHSLPLAQWTFLLLPELSLNQPLNTLDRWLAFCTFCLLSLLSNQAFCFAK